MESYVVQLAKLAYAAYGTATDGKNFLGGIMPEWERLPSGIQEAWCAAVSSVVDHVTTNARSSS